MSEKADNNKSSNPPKNEAPKKNLPPPTPKNKTKMVRNSADAPNPFDRSNHTQKNDKKNNTKKK